MAMPASDPARRGNERGDGTRAAIMAVLRGRIRDGHQAPTLDEVVTATGLGKTTIRYHITLLAATGTVRYQKRREIVLVEDGGVLVPAADDSPVGADAPDPVRP